MREKTAITLIVGLTAVFTANLMVAHHSFAPTFDTDKVVSRKGVVVKFEWLNPHSYILVESKGVNGVVEHWALEGPSPTTMARKNIDKASFKVGDSLEFCGYATREGISPVRTVAASSGRLILAELLKFPDGRKVLWNDYGLRKCRDAHNL